MASPKPGTRDPFMPDDDTPELTDAEIRRLRPAREVFDAHGVRVPRPGRPPSESPKKQVTLRLDPEILEYFRATGRGWQTRLNDTLKHAIEADKADVD